MTAARRRPVAPPRACGGFALVAALFLMVVLATLGAVVVRLSVVQHQTVTLALQAARAYGAARSGIEWGAYLALVNGTCGSGTLGLTEGGVTGFTVDVDCTSTTHTEGARTTTVYAIEAFSYAGTYGGPDYVSRRIRATVTDAM